MSGHSPGIWIHVTLNSMFQCSDSFRYRMKKSHKSRPFSNPLVGTSGRCVIAKQGHLCRGSQILSYGLLEDHTLLIYSKWNYLRATRLFNQTRRWPINSYEGD